MPFGHFEQIFKRDFVICFMIEWILFELSGLNKKIMRKVEEYCRISREIQKFSSLLIIKILVFAIPSQKNLKFPDFDLNWIF